MVLALKRPPRFLPRNPRVGVNLAASLVLPSDEVVPVHIENLSPQGFMGKCAHQLSPGLWLGAELPGHGILRARVRWSQDGEAGFQFRSPIDLERYPWLGHHETRGLFAVPLRSAMAPSEW
ncbi:hypothetical protein GCM10011515_20230 [Tsuneonella deserti]|uniref:PilZ domain-containing protein n=1 Tax=Tsuneonella deserti TaxID=2035528 RepID=A0ABQ1S9A5_9SPHN|nr:PilZ domain-containing protein [Tsuneonella deserti]GGE00381.1 hypothetical protein GCM10011515_20230 [Tsuneonella deserti]